MAKMTDKMTALAGVPLFADLSKKELELLGRMTTEVDFSAGQEMAKQGEMGREAMIILSGGADVIRDGDTIASLEAGDVFGEMSLINRMPRNASVLATSDGTVAVMSRTEFNSVLTSNPGVTTTILQTVTARLVELMDD